MNNLELTVERFEQLLWILYAVFEAPRSRRVVVADDVGALLAETEALANACTIDGYVRAELRGLIPDALFDRLDAALAAARVKH